MKVRVRLINKETEEINEHEIFMGDLPLMTETGTFVINGAERVIVSQLVRSPGIYYAIAHDKVGKRLFSSTVIPNRGAWLEYETDSNDVFYVRVDRTRKVPITVLIRALGAVSYTHLDVYKRQVAVYKDELYNLPFNMNTFSKMWNIRTPQEAKEIIEKQRKETGITYPQNLEEQALFLGGRDIYEKLIKGYTEKQWGRKCTELPAFIIKRLPFRFVYDNNYFNERYQGIPVGGYTACLLYTSRCV